MAAADLPDPGLPIKLNPYSNGEFDPLPTTPATREAVRLARRMCEENAKRIGMDRRRFLLSSMGAATTLYALAACSSDEKNAGSGGGKENGGTFDVPEDAMVDAETALDTLGSDQPVVDVQTHLLEYPPDFDGYHLGNFFTGLPEPFGRTCGEMELNECFSIDTYVTEMFERSDTTVAVLSALPAYTDLDPLSAEVMENARRQIDRLCGDARIRVQGHAWVNVGEPEAALDALNAELERYPDLIAWKAYTSVGPGWMLDDSKGEPLGEAFLQRVEEIGPNIVAVHKGLSQIGEAQYNDPADVGPAAKNHPDINFAIYHSAYEPGTPEGPYDSANPNGSIDRLVKTLEDNGIGPDGNVYAELGSTWNILVGINNMDSTAHALGKLLNQLGPERILWGTDSIWTGTPHDQIQAFRSFQFSDEFREQFGYPELTDEIKHRILWQNASELYKIDVWSTPCEISSEATEEARAASPLGNQTYGPRTAFSRRALFRAEHPWVFNR